MSNLTWPNREMPILRAIAAAEDAGEDLTSAAYKATELPRREVTLCLSRLYDGGYIEASINRGDDEIQSVHVVKSLPKLLREIGVWPRAAAPLEAKRFQRLALMEAVYNRTDGNPLERLVVDEIARDLRWEVEATWDVALYLRDEGLLAFPTMGCVGITHAGVVEMEEAIVEPNRATSHFPPINIFTSAVT